MFYPLHDPLQSATFLKSKVQSLKSKVGFGRIWSDLVGCGWKEPLTLYPSPVRRQRECQPTPPFPSLDPLHRYKLGKYGSKLRSHPLQTRYKPVTGGVTNWGRLNKLKG
jgi:hypothetical protein